MSTISRVSVTAFAALLSVSAFAAKPAAHEAKIVFDPASSVVKWEGKKVTGKHNGEIKLKSAEIVMSGEDLKGGEFVIDMTTISNNDLTDAEYNKKLVTHLSSDDFFNAPKFPTSVLKIKKVKSVHGITGPTYEVVGDLTIKGKTNEIKFPMMIATKDGKTTATANITVDRTKWNIKYGSGKFFTGLGDKVISDEFQVDVALSSK
jgi:polyisoprenoid-binding protein YceI